ncbi:DUF6503 family protein [Marinoscillum sp. MHG1-6]|uniref:DUF6503 family protein n=1 Tax=Marinoscillum sp. MHG1-6 TaxID=2959627 RepID=UPI0021586C0A|nr:DUF6503 family protein [Marinoscillum sp. MHG1-6]
MKIFDVHGGYDQWKTMNSLYFEVRSEKHVISLADRKVRLSNGEHIIGFDGEQVWVSPDTADVPNAQYYYNLYFYFFAMPFVFGDPGIYYEELETKTILGKQYNAIKVSYDAGVGDSPKDNYIIFYEPDTYQMKWLMYTFTFKTQQTSDRFKLIQYDQWQTVNSLVLPKVIRWFEYSDGKVGNQRSEVQFEQVRIEPDMIDSLFFEKPKSAKLNS